MPELYTRADFSKELIKLFQKEYEKYVLEIMNDSKVVFPDKYEYVKVQSNGECDFISSKNEKFDAKLPFTTDQMKLLTCGKAHKPLVEDWIKELLAESTEYSQCISMRGNFNVSSTKLYQIMLNLISKDKADENIIFFIPFPVVLSIPESIFSQFITDFLKDIYSNLKCSIDLKNRSIYAIWPSAERNVFAVRKFGDDFTEFIENKNIGKYLSYETSNKQLW